ncbi:fimbrial protein [Kluyvera sichuanensis]|uniref:fimbrial protein n=1 Tax=Kluyvera sichuanensis TaxID=2725494 RepID=UPI0039F5B507
MKKINMIVITFFLLFSKSTFAEGCGGITLQQGILNIPTITISDSFSTGVGDILYSTVLTHSGISGYNCTAQNKSNFAMTYSGLLYGNHIYYTSVPGIGIRIWEGTTGMVNGQYDNPPFETTTSATYVNGYGYTYNNYSETIEFVKIGRISAGVLPAGIIAQYRAITNVGNMQTMYEIYMNSVVVNASGCTVTTSSENIYLGEYRTTDFENIGSTSESQPINISLDCNLGTKVNTTISAIADSTQPGTIKLSEGEEIATGVGVQLLDKNNTPLNIGSQFLIDTVDTEGQYTINWSSHYIKTAEKMTPGIANAVATISFNYE